jgi:regulation of enolase protein 1 (concanavalin A-like superfamily)
MTAVFSHVSEASPASDDFSQCVLNANRWMLINPVGDAGFEMTGTTARFTIPASSAHNLWEDEMDALRIMQTTENVSFEVTAKFEDLPTEQFQMQGILVEQDEDNWLRFDVFHRNGRLLVHAAETVDGSSKSLVSSEIIPGTSTQVFLRVERNGNRWTESYSFNGSDWTTAISFIRPLNVTASGIFVGNTAATPADYVADVDYIFNSLAPIDPEDQGNTIDVDVVGQGQVQISPLKAEYACGEEVTLTAAPANDEWLFAGWSGDFSGTQNPATLTVQGDYRITATFSQGLDLFLPVIVRN